MAFKRTRLNKSTTQTTRSNGKTSTSVRHNPMRVGSTQTSVTTHSDGKRVRTTTQNHGGGWITRKTQVLWSPKKVKFKQTAAPSATQRAIALYAAPTILPATVGLVVVGYGLMHFPFMTLLLCLGIVGTLILGKWLASKAE